MKTFDMIQHDQLCQQCQSAVRLVSRQTMSQTRMQCLTVSM